MNLGSRCLLIKGLGLNYLLSGLFLGIQNRFWSITLLASCYTFWCPSAYLCFSNDKTQFCVFRNGKGKLLLFPSYRQAGLIFSRWKIFSVFSCKNGCALERQTAYSQEKQGTPASCGQPEPWRTQSRAVTEDKPGSRPELRNPRNNWSRF